RDRDRGGGGRVARPGRRGVRDRTGQPGRVGGIAARRNRARAGRHTAEASMTGRISLAPYLADLEHIPALRWTGQVTQVVGLLVESRGPAVAIGDFCEIRAAGGRLIRTQVIGFRDGRVLSMPLEEIDG